MLLSYLVFVTDYTQFDRSWLFSINFGIDQTYMTNHVIVLSIFNHKSHPIWFVTKVQLGFTRRPYIYYWVHHCSIWFSSYTTLDAIIFGINCTYTIGHVIVFSCFCQRLHLFQSITKDHYCFHRRLYLYDQSHHCPIWFSSQITLN